VFLSKITAMCSYRHGSTFTAVYSAFYPLWDSKMCIDLTA